MNMKVEILSGGVKLTGLTSNYRRVQQELEHPGVRLAGKKITVTLNITECTGKFASYLIYGASLASSTTGTVISAGQTGLVRYTITLPAAAEMENRLALVIASSDEIDVSLTLKSVKMELGGVSTLKDGDTADYAEQLALCQRFLLPIQQDARFRLIGIPSATTLQFSIPVPSNMRTLPSIEDTSAFKLVTIALSRVPAGAIASIEGLRRYTGFLLRVTTEAAHGLSDGLLYADAATFLNAEL